LERFCGGRGVDLLIDCLYFFVYQSHHPPHHKKIPIIICSRFAQFPVWGAKITFIAISFRIIQPEVLCFMVLIGRLDQVTLFSFPAESI
jgi:hypothetical protein